MLHGFTFLCLVSGPSSFVNNGSDDYYMILNKLKSFYLYFFSSNLLGSEVMFPLILLFLDALEWHIMKRIVNKLHEYLCLCQKKKKKYKWTRRCEEEVWSIGWREIAAKAVVTGSIFIEVLIDDQIRYIWIAAFTIIPGNSKTSIFPHSFNWLSLLTFVTCSGSHKLHQVNSKW